MIKKLFFACLLSSLSALAFAQTNDWKEYFGNESVSIEYIYTECHHPEKGVHHENVLLRIKNKTENDVKVSYTLSRIYNDKEVKGDAPDFNFLLTAHGVQQSSCDDLTEGLYIFSRILDLKANSVLNSFELKNLTINGQPVSR